VSYLTNNTFDFSQSDHGIHRSDAQAQVNKIPVIEVNGNHAVCDGGGGALGHPVEWIQLDTVSKLPQVCKYCGLRFIKAKGGAHHH
jgi:NADH dehydrogenase (ubiquinone) Fe-S protein 6